MRTLGFTSVMRMSACSLVLALCMVGSACTDNHLGPQTGTETGNPPVLDRGAITLIMRDDGVHLVGGRGAVLPGGTTVEVTNLRTGRVSIGVSAGDGSFDVQLAGASLNDAVSVRAMEGELSTDLARIAPAVAPSSKLDGTQIGTVDQPLECAQAEEQAEQQMRTAAPSFDLSCESDEDCIETNLHTYCGAGCEGYALSLTGFSQMLKHSQAVNNALCERLYLAPKCDQRDLHCAAPAPTKVSCVDKQCVFVTLGPGSYDCTSPFEQYYGTPTQRIWWFSAEDNDCVVRRYNGAGGNGNRYPTREACALACSRATECPDGRVMTNACTDASCTKSVGLCAKQCATDMDCNESDVPHTCNSSGFCEPAGL